MTLPGSPEQKTNRDGGAWSFLVYCRVGSPDMLKVSELQGIQVEERLRAVEAHLSKK